MLKYTTKELDLMARLMRAEALSDGDLAMLMVGNVVVNRAIASCLTFTNVRTLTDVIYQKNQFVGTNSSLFNSFCFLGVGRTSSTGSFLGTSIFNIPFLKMRRNKKRLKIQPFLCKLTCNFIIT